MTLSAEVKNELPSTLIKRCPVGAELAVMGRKWTFHIIKNIGMLGIDRFNQILKTLPGLTPRVLIMRLNELEQSSLIQSIIIQEKPRLVRWVLTEKGLDTLPIIRGYDSYMEKWHPNASLKNHLRIKNGRAPSVQELFEQYRQETAG